MLKQSGYTCDLFKTEMFMMIWHCDT